MEAFTQFLPVLGLLLLLLLCHYKRSIRNNTKKAIKLVAPEPSGALPFLGHLHFLRGQAPLARVLGKIADEYGPVYTLRLGGRRALVVSSWQMVKDCFTTNDRNFAARPNMAISRHMVYNKAGFALATYGPYWREIRNSEVKSFINELSLFSSKKANKASVVDMSKWFENITFNITIKILAGKRFSNTGGNEGYVKAMKQVAKEVDEVIGKWLDEHVQKRKEYDGEKEADFMDVMLSTLSKDAEMYGHGRETIIKATTMVLMLTGSESTALTLTWALSLLLNNPHILKAAQKELDMNVGKQKWVEESDIKNLRYLQAIVKETLRMYPPGPLAGPHEAIEDCYIGGYHISKGTRLIVNLWKLHRDPQIWSDPHEFRPERFLEEHSDLNYQGQNFEYIPFSTGRRMCPAITFAFQVVHLTLARLLQGFDLSTPMGKPVDMSEGLGIALPKVRPLEVIMTPRLSTELYQNL
ncbi:unnamed protein product [Lactuca virosa]|uniref:Uncharacterized protein n=1 Tax=Lactuca virosa TaxID=75947 RepID=A0AAU9PAG3_9ASTR|nr:unnamed protein product [Lactuca virosa]